MVVNAKTRARSQFPGSRPAAATEPSQWPMPSAASWSPSYTPARSRKLQTALICPQKSVPSPRAAVGANRVCETILARCRDLAQAAPANRPMFLPFFGPPVRVAPAVRPAGERKSAAVAQWECAILAVEKKVPFQKKKEPIRRIRPRIVAGTCWTRQWDWIRVTAVR